MGNIAITSKCNLQCSYCFAHEYREGKKSTQYMSTTIFENALDFIVRSELDQIRILGGEPTLHPQFIQFTELALKTGFPVTLFSNGFIPDKVIDFLSELSNEDIHIILNITYLADNMLSLPEKTLMKLNRNIIPGCNLYKKNIEIDFIIDLINDYDLIRRVRLGLAHPCIGFKNIHLSPKNYLSIGQKIFCFIERAKKESIIPNFDCGFVPCLFKSEELKEIGMDELLRPHCEPIPDILPDGNIIPCYSLSSVSQMKLNSDLTSKDIFENFINHIPEYHNFGIFKICSICKYKKSKICQGGCSAHKILNSNSLENISVNIN